MYGDSADIQRDPRNIRKRVAVVEIGLTFTAINVVSNNATTEKAVTNVEIKGSERGKKGSRWQREVETEVASREEREIETGLLILE